MRCGLLARRQRANSPSSRAIPGGNLGLVSWIVADVMTRDVVTVRPSTTYAACIRLMRMHGVGALPVVDESKVVGIVCMTDLLLKRRDGGAASFFMTPPVITTSPDTPISAAVRRMFEHAINRLPVVDAERRLVGILSRSDVLRMFLRSDLSIRKEVRTAVAGDMPFIGKGTVWAEVTDGVVTLDGEVEPGTMTDVLLRLVASVPGVVGVKNQLKVKGPKDAGASTTSPQSRLTRISRP
jgi:CBS-domain-containing membrane protein